MEGRQIEQGYPDTVSIGQPLSTWSATMNSIYVKWQVQCRLSRKHAWRPKGTFETRADARYRVACMRDGFVGSDGFVKGLGFGNTRVVRKEVK